MPDLNRLVRGPLSMLVDVTDKAGITRFGDYWPTERPRWIAAVSRNQHTELAELNIQELYILWCCISDDYAYADFADLVAQSWNR